MNRQHSYRIWRTSIFFPSCYKEKLHRQVVTNEQAKSVALRSLQVILVQVWVGGEVVVGQLFSVDLMFGECGCSVGVSESPISIYLCSLFDPSVFDDPCSVSILSAHHGRVSYVSGSGHQASRAYGAGRVSTVSACDRGSGFFGYRLAAFGYDSRKALEISLYLSPSVVYHDRKTFHRTAEFQGARSS